MSPTGTIASITVGDRIIRLVVEDPDDCIQSWHLGHRFYEEEELEIIARFFPRGGVFVDIGANVGNHSIYSAVVLGAKRVIAFEPNPEACAILRKNVELNDLGGVIDLTHLGTGLSDRFEEASIALRPANNLGAVRFAPSEHGIPFFPGDSLLAEEPLDFLKIDVEMMEMRVLAGLRRVIATRRPQIFIEIGNDLISTFRSWVAVNGYKIVATYRRYRFVENFMIVPE